MQLLATCEIQKCILDERQKWKLVCPRAQKSKVDFLWMKMMMFKTEVALMKIMCSRNSIYIW